MIYKLIITKVLLLVLFVLPCRSQNHVFLDPSSPLDERVNDLVSKLTLEEKVGQMMNSSPVIPRLNIPAYDWWNESNKLAQLKPSFS